MERRVYEGCRNPGTIREEYNINMCGKNFKYIAGADVSYLHQRTIQSGIHQNESAGRASYSSAGTKKSGMLYVSVVVFESKTMERVEAVTASGRVDFPYIPGLLSFRESPILLKAFAKIKSNPDVVIFRCTRHCASSWDRFGVSYWVAVRQAINRVC